MAQTTISNVYYNVPQDKDDPDVPNVFWYNLAAIKLLKYYHNYYTVPKSLEDIRLADIRQYFPLNGSYIFRFKYKYNSQPVWMDIPENSKKLPIFEGRIFVKATRISWGEQQKKQETPQAVNQQPNEVPQPVVSKNIQESNAVNRPPSNQQYIDFFGDDEQSSSQAQAVNQNQQASNLIDF